MEEIDPRMCLVTGATGVIGVPLVRDLLDRGHKVRILARSPIKSELFGGPVEVSLGDLRDFDAVQRAAEGVDWVFHLAAKLHINDPGVESGDEYNAINVEGTGNLIEAASGATKFVFFSTINVYGPGLPGEIFDETSDPHPLGVYAESKAKAERLVLAAQNAEGQNIGVILRLAAVYGSRMKGNYVRLTEALRKGRFFFIGKGDNRRTLVHYSDVVQAALLAADKAVGGSVYNVTDGSVHTMNAITASICHALGRKVPRLHFPLLPVKIGVAGVETAATALGVKPPVSRSLLGKLVEDIAVDGSKIQHELGFRPRFSLESGWEEAITVGRQKNEH